MTQNDKGELNESPDPGKRHPAIQKIIDDSRKLIRSYDELKEHFYIQDDLLEDGNQERIHLTQNQAKSTLDYISFVDTFLMQKAFYFLEIEMNERYAKLLQRKNDEEDYEMKKIVAGEINASLRKYASAIVHPQTYEACSLLAVGSPDTHGRYLLESKTTKKRSMTCKSLRVLLPLTLCYYFHYY